MHGNKRVLWPAFCCDNHYIGRSRGVSKPTGCCGCGWRATMPSHGPPVVFPLLLVEEQEKINGGVPIYCDSKRPVIRTIKVSPSGFKFNSRGCGFKTEVSVKKGSATLSTQFL